MPNPNSSNFSSSQNTPEVARTNEATNAELQARGIRANESVEAEPNRFLGISREELLKINPDNLTDSEKPDFIAAHKAWIAKYEKILAEIQEKEAAQANEPEAEAAQASEAEAETAAAQVPDTSTEPDIEPDDTDTVAATAPIVTPVSPEEAGEVKTLTPERIAATKEDTNQNPKAKGFFNNIVKKVTPIVLTAAIALGGIVGATAIANQDKPQDNTEPPATEQISGTYSSYDDYSSVGEQHEQHGIKDGYYEPGEFMSANKGTPYDFANAAEVADAIGVQDECDVMKEVAHNQVESLADQLACIPDTVKAKYGVSSDFLGGISIKDTEAKIESLSEADYDKLIKQVDQIWDDAFTESVTLNGEYQNAFMRTSATGDEKVTHNNTEVVACTTQENGTAATKFFWTIDDNANSTRMGDVTAKISRDANGHIAQGEGMGQCTQIVTEVGTFSFLYDGLTVVPSNPDHPGQPTPTPPGPTPTPPEEIKSKDYENMERIDQNILDDIAEDVGTDEVRVTPNPGVSQDNLTEKPSPSDYEGTEADTVQNTPSESAESVQDQVSPENDHSQNQGGANADEYTPVQANEAAQEAADAAEIPVNQAPTGGQELDNALNDLGIN